LNDVKEIFIDYFIETKTANKDTIIIAKGLDGILYRLIVSKTKAFTPYPTDFDSENNRRRLESPMGGLDKYPLGESLYMMMKDYKLHIGNISLSGWACIFAQLCQ
jgi:hypothetical protein